MTAAFTSGLSESLKTQRSPLSTLCRPGPASHCDCAAAYEVHPQNLWDMSAAPSVSIPLTKLLSLSLASIQHLVSRHCLFCPPPHCV